MFLQRPICFILLLLDPTSKTLHILEYSLVVGQVNPRATQVEQEWREYYHGKVLDHALSRAVILTEPVFFV